MSSEFFVDVQEAARRLNTTPEALRHRILRNSSYLAGHARCGRQIVWPREDFDDIVRQTLFGVKMKPGRPRRTGD
jgi:hypothetical protein